MQKHEDLRIWAPHKFGFGRLEAISGYFNLAWQILWHKKGVFDEI